MPASTILLVASDAASGDAIKTILSGGGYGVLNLGVDNNSGLYESSIISTFAIALIPIVIIFGYLALVRRTGALDNL